MQNKNTHLVIMAGGIGNRFWPLSTPKHPKQFIDIVGCGRTLLQLTADRFKNICPYENIWIVTSSDYKHFVKEQLPQIPEDNILEEPCRRNTAPCIAYVSWKISKKYPNAHIIVSPSDHIVTDIHEFERIIQLAVNSINDSDNIVTLGIQPTRPDTGYGYIEVQTEDTGKSTQEIYPVKAFKEKPCLELAQKYIQQNNFFWNAGIFIWNVHTIINSLKICQKEIASIFDEIADSFYTDQEQETINKYFPLCPGISIDYAVLEKADNIYVIPGDFGWSDLGTWGSLHTQLSQDSLKNGAVGNNIHFIESEECIVYLPENKKAIIQGLKGYIITEKEKTLLICKLSEEQRIKEFSEL